MSALAMILTAAMATPGDGAEKVSAVMVQRGLDLSGEWKGDFTSSNGKIFKGKMKESVFVLTPGEKPLIDLGPKYITDEGNGRFAIGRGANGPVFVGIYKDEGDKLTICLCATQYGRPTKFKAGEGRGLLILHRVKPSK
jgi:hypothetical protein